MPGILVSSLANRSGTAPEEATMPTYVASQLDELGEPRIYYWWALLERARRLSSDLSNDASTLRGERGRDIWIAA
jgi:hypothetical protein